MTVSAWSAGLDEVLRTVAMQMAQALDVASCSISNWDPEKEVLTTLAAEAAHPSLVGSGVTRDVGESYSAADYPATAETLRQRRPRLVQAGDPKADAAERALLQKFGQKSLLMIPLVARDQVVGLVELYEDRQVRVFTEDDVRLGSALANQAAIAFANARLYERPDDRLQARVDELTTMERITAELNATLELDHILRIVLDAAVRTTGASHGNVMLLDMGSSDGAEDPRLVLRIAQGYSEEERAAIDEVLLAPAEDPAAESMVRQVARHGQARIVEDAWQEPCIVCVRSSTRSALIVPIFYEGSVVGLINLRQGPPGAFDQMDLSFVQSLAQQAAVALGNAMRFEEQVRVNTSLRERSEQMTRLLEVSRKLRTDVPLEETLEEIAYAIQETVGFDLVLISVVEGAPRALRRLAAAGLSLRQFEELARIRQPAERYEALFCEEYQLGPAYFFPWQKREAWGAELHTATPMPEVEEWQEGRWHPHDMLLVPLRGAGGRVVGHISVDEPRDGLRPSQRTIEVLAIFANQAAIAVENAKLYADAQRRADNLALINEVGRTLSQVLDPELVVHTVVQAVTELLDCELSAIFQSDSRDGKLVAVAGEGVNLAGLSRLRFAPGEGVVGRVAESRRALWIPDPGGESLFDEGPVPVCSMLLAPMIAGKQLIGVVTAGWSHAHGQSEADEVLLTTLADQAAVALHNARLFQETERHAAELATINEIGRAISRALDTSDLYEMLYHQVSKLLDTPDFHIALYDAESDLVHIEFLVEHGRVQPPFTLKLGQGLTGYLVRHGEPILLSHGSEAFLAEHGLSLEREPARSWLGVPMVAEGRVIGAMAVQNFDQDDAFDREHLQLLRTIAGQAAIAFQNARLFEERERRIFELAALNEIAQTISSTLELDSLLELVYRQVSRLMDTTHFCIALYNKEADEITFPFVVDPEGWENWSPRKRRGDLAGRVIQMAQPLLLRHGGGGLAEEPGAEIDLGARACWLGVPMIAEDKVLGVISVQSYTQADLYGQDDLNLLMTVASQSAVAVRNAQLYEQIVRFSSGLEEMVEKRTRDLARALDELTVERDRAETLYRIASELGASLELERVLERALQLFADALGVWHGTILLVDPETGRMTLRATLDRERKLPREGELTPWTRGVGLAGWVLQEGEAVLIPDITQDKRWVQRPDKPVHVRSVVAAPLSLYGGDILGILTLGHPQVGYFTPDHMQLVMAATAQIAIAVNNSDLYAVITHQAEQLGAALQAQGEEVAKNRAILESIADGVLVLDHSGHVLLVNPAAEELLGFPAAALEGRHVRHMLGLGETSAHRELIQALYTELQQRLEEGAREAIPAEGKIRLEAGETVLAANVAPLIVSRAAVPGVVAALRDISREAEVERFKNEFISTVSHELRTPMTSIKGYTDLLFLGMAGELTDKQRGFLQIIKSNTDRLTALVADLLDISRIETGRIRLTIEALDMVQLINGVVSSFLEQYRDKGLRLNWEVPAELPEVRGDATRVSQVLSNLMDNAWRYTAEGGQVTISARRRNGFLQVDIADTGIGIAVEDQGRIFDRFFRADHPMVQEAGGSGLGLSIAKMFVEMLGGRIWVESEEGTGSTFGFTLPLFSAEPPEPAAELLASETMTEELPR
jgi:PAS domain S-box-containing protein